MNSLFRRAQILLFVALGCCALGASEARGQPADPKKAPAARALYEQALADMDAHRYATACRKLEEVIGMAPEALGAKITLAECYQKEGRLASAWAQYSQVNELATKAGEADRANRASRSAAALRPKLATLVIEVPSEARAIAGLTITRDGLPIRETLWGTPLPIDAGAHALVVTAPAHKPWEKPVDIASDGVSVSVVVEPLAPLPAKPPSAPRPIAAPPEKSRLSTQKVAALSLGGAGVMGVAVGAGLGVWATTAWSSALEGCARPEEKSGCNPSAQDQGRHAGTIADASTIAFVAGGALVAGAAVLWFTAPAAERASTGRLELIPLVGETITGGVLRATF